MHEVKQLSGLLLSSTHIVCMNAVSGGQEGTKRSVTLRYCTVLLSCSLCWLFVVVVVFVNDSVFADKVCNAS